MNNKQFNDNVNNILFLQNPNKFEIVLCIYVMKIIDYTACLHCCFNELQCYLVPFEKNLLDSALKGCP